MISIPGTITIRSIQGRFGYFNTGTLECELGIFAVKDATIEGFEEGTYNGDFVIEKIKPNSYFSSGRLVVEVRAILTDIILYDDALPQSPINDSLEQDPLEQEQENFQPQQANPYNQGQQHSSQQYDDDQDTEIASLFGPLWPLGDVVKLDPVVGRSLLRQQKDYLQNVLNYEFIPTQQVWVRSN